MPFRKNPPQLRNDPTAEKFLPRRIFGIASTELFQPTQTKRQKAIAWCGGVESQRFQRFLLGIVDFQFCNKS